MERERIKINWCVLFIIFFYLHHVMFRVSIIGSYAIVYGIPVIYLLLSRFRGKIILRREQLSVLVLFGIMLSMALVWPILFSTYDYGNIHVLMLIIEKYFVFSFLIVVLQKVFGKKMTIEHFFYYYAMSMALYVCITILFFAFPSIKNAWFDIIYISPDNLSIMNRYGYDMRIGFSGFSGFRKTIPCTVSILFIMHMQWGKDSAVKMSAVQFTIVLILCLIGNAFYGRSGVAISLLALILGLILYKKIRISNVIKLVMCIVALVYILGEMRDTEIFHDWISWMSTPFINLALSGEFNNGSVDELNRMLFVPEWKVLLFGTGIMAKNYTTGSVLLGNDSGIMRNIIYWGIGGCVVVYTLVCENYRLLRIKDWVFGVLLLGSLFIFEIKGDVYYEFLAMFMACYRIHNICREKDLGAIQ